MFCDLFGGMENCDWGLTFSIIKDIVTIVSIVIATILAISGVNLWKSQLIGKENYNLASEYLILLKRIREEFLVVRNKFMDSNENYVAMKELDIEEKDFSKESFKIVRWVFVIRFRKLAEIYNKLTELKFSIEALWDEDFTEEIRNLRERVWTLNSEIDLFGNLEEEPDSIKRNKKIVFGIRGDNFDVKLVKAIDGLEIKLKPYLRIKKRIPLSK